MYPSEKTPSYGVFVKNFETDMLKRGVCFKKAVIKGKAERLLCKVKKYIVFFSQVYKSIFDKDIDLIYVHYISHSLLPLIPIIPFLNRPVVINVHGSDLLPRGIFSKLILKLNYYSIKKSSMIVVPSVYFKDIVDNRYHHPNVFISASGGVDLSVFNCRETEEYDFDGLCFGYVSRIEEGKGWDVFLNSLLILKNNKLDTKFKAIVVGSGSQEAYLDKAIKELELDSYITRIGSQSQAALVKLFREFDVFVFPTMLRESLGLVGIESMACGTIVLGSRIGGIKTYVEDGVNGFLFEPGDAAQLAALFLRYASLSDVEKNIMSNNAIRTARLYDKEIVGKALAVELYKLIKI